MVFMKKGLQNLIWNEKEINVMDSNYKKMLPFSVQVHHSFVDGIHIGKLADSLQNQLNIFGIL